MWSKALFVAAAVAASSICSAKALNRDEPGPGQLSIGVASEALKTPPSFLQLGTKPDTKRLYVKTHLTMATGRYILQQIGRGVGKYNGVNVTWANLELAPCEAINVSLIG
eukprot:Selendium_serpulae@DN2715_c0_g1_i3.p2